MLSRINNLPAASGVKPLDLKAKPTQSMQKAPMTPKTLQQCKDSIRALLCNVKPPCAPLPKPGSFTLPSREVQPATQCFSPFDSRFPKVSFPARSAIKSVAPASKVVQAQPPIKPVMPQMKQAVVPTKAHTVSRVSPRNAQMASAVVRTLSSIKPPFAKMPKAGSFVLPSREAQADMQCYSPFDARFPKVSLPAVRAPIKAAPAPVKAAPVVAKASSAPIAKAAPAAVAKATPATRHDIQKHQSPKNKKQQKNASPQHKNLVKGLMSAATANTKSAGKAQRRRLMKEHKHHIPHFRNQAWSFAGFHAVSPFDVDFLLLCKKAAPSAKQLQMQKQMLKHKTPATASAAPKKQQQTQVKPQQRQQAQQQQQWPALQTSFKWETKQKPAAFSSGKSWATSASSIKGSLKA